ncbi:MAG: carboxylate--amine ligase [Candidatus Deferrimicrobiaceae bacterium]
MKVLVTNCTRNSGLTAMRALANAGWDVLGADDRLLPLGLHSRYSAVAYERLPAEDDPAFAPALLDLLDKVHPDVLIPTRGIGAACGVREEIGRRTRCLLPSPEAFEGLMDKKRLFERCGALGIPVPASFSLAEALRFLKEDPSAMVVVKPRRDVGGGRGVHFVSDPSGLPSIYEGVVAGHGAAVITDFVPGPTENLRAAHLLFDSESRLVAFFVLRKSRIWPPRVGITVGAQSTHETALVKRLLPLFRDLGWQGPADAELKFDPRDGEAKVLEINPRFSGAIHFPIECGVNMPLLFCRAALGERLEEATRPAYPSGMRYLDLGRWVAGVAAEMREPSAGVPATLRRAWGEFHGRRVESIYEFRDPAPILGKLLMMLPCPRGGPLA